MQLHVCVHFDVFCYFAHAWVDNPQLLTVFQRYASGGYQDLHSVHVRVWVGVLDLGHADLLLALRAVHSEDAVLVDSAAAIPDGLDGVAGRVLPLLDSYVFPFCAKQSGGGFGSGSVF